VGYVDLLCGNNWYGYQTYLGIKQMNYDFSNSLTDIRSVVHLIGMHGPNLKGLELGVDRAQSHCTLLQACPNIDLLIGIDNWEPYTDYLREDNRPDSPSNSTSPAEMEIFEFMAHHHVKFSGESRRSQLIKGNAEDLVQQFQDLEFDFIFMDAWLSYEQSLKELDDWYPKVKIGGLFIGHDYKCEPIQAAVERFRHDNKIDNYMSVYDSAFVWRK
tara:strand:+ start:30 stop:674 length:645 start_codon:yes stop_codon:yes gene_type:complete